MLYDSRGTALWLRDSQFAEQRSHHLVVAELQHGNRDGSRMDGREIGCWMGSAPGSQLKRGRMQIMSELMGATGQWRRNPFGSVLLDRVHGEHRKDPLCPSTEAIG